MRITASDVAHITGGRLVGANSAATSISFDSRTLHAGEAFVAIVAERDGNAFLLAVRDAGAAFAVVSQGRSVDGLTCVEVDDTTQALAVLGRHYKTQLVGANKAPVIGITGSTGKTTTKNLVRAVLREKYDHVHAAEHSLNNDIGVPVTMLNASDDTDALVLEMGMRGFHEIERLCTIAEPNIGVITNIGDAHGERVGGAAGIARAKGELFQALPEDGTAIVNGDSEWCAYLSALAQCRVLTFGRTDADVLWSIESTDEFGVCTARFSYDGESIVATPIHPGEHMVANAAAAITVGIACGMSLQDAGRGVGREATEWGRMVWLENSAGQRILDDTYNANEASMIAALRVLASADGERKVAVLGQMSEVTDERGAHQNVAALAKELNIQLLPYNTDLYGRLGLSLDQVINHLKSEKWDSLLVKGSRAAATEDVIVQLMTV